jgi:Putative esterase
MDRPSALEELAAFGRVTPQAPPLQARPPPLVTQTTVTISSYSMGEFATETFNYDGGRQVTAYVPPVPPEAVVFAGDGHLTAQWGGVLEGADVPPTMIVGTHRLEDEAARLNEYSPVFDAERFAAHEKFFVEDVRQWVRSRLGVALPAERTAVFGVSASGELALAVGLRHPHIYGAVFCASPGGGYRPPAVMPNSLRARTSSPAGWSRSFSRTPAAGPTRCATRVRTLSWPSGLGRTETRSGEKSSR